MLLMLVNSIRLSLHGVVLLVAWSRSFEHIASTLWLIALLCGLNMAVTCAFRHVKPNYTCDPYISHTLPIIIDQYYPSPFCFWAWRGRHIACNSQYSRLCIASTLEMTIHSVCEQEEYVDDILWDCKMLQRDSLPESRLTTLQTFAAKCRNCEIMSYRAGHCLKFMRALAIRLQLFHCWNHDSLADYSWLKLAMLIMTSRG